MFKTSYTQEEFDELIANATTRKGWDFSSMHTQRQTVPWNYIDIVRLYISSEDTVLDIGTGGGENFLKLSKLFKTGMGVDIDAEMIQVARENAKGVHNVSFYQDTQRLDETHNIFDVIINRHAPFDLDAISSHLRSRGYFITQQVGEKNMSNIKRVINKVIESPVISQEIIKKSGIKLLAFMEYDVEYVVKDVESLVFWLHALDMLHADLPGNETLRDVGIFNQILKGNVHEQGFITNEHRYIAIAQK